MAEEKEKNVDRKVEEEQLKKIRETISQKFLSILDPSVLKRMDYKTFSSSFLMRNDVVGDLSNKILEAAVERLSIDMDEAEIEIPNNYAVVKVNPEDHEKIVVESLVRGIPMLRSIKQSIEGVKKIITIRHYLLIKDLDIVLFDEIKGLAPQEKPSPEKPARQQKK